MTRSVCDDLYVAGQCIPVDVRAVDASEAQAPRQAIRAESTPPPRDTRPAGPACPAPVDAGQAFDPPPHVSVTAGPVSVTGAVHQSGPWLAISRPGQPRIAAALAPLPHGAWVWVEGRARRVLLPDAPEVRARAESTAGPGAPLVSPPMPAVVTEVLVAEGDAVRAGDRVAVVSAMKMELPLVAPHDGVVSAVRARPGDKVSPGDRVVDIVRAGDTDDSAPSASGETTFREPGQ